MASSRQLGSMRVILFDCRAASSRPSCYSERLVKPSHLQCHANDFGKMQCAAASKLGNLLAATEPIRHNNCVVWRVFEGWQEHEFAGLQGNLVMLLFKTETTGHAAASGIEQLAIQPHPAQHFRLTPHAH